MNELRVAGCTTLAEANRFLHDTYRPRHNERFAVAPAEAASGFTPLFGVDLDRILCLEGTRCVNRDNTVVLGRRVLQLPEAAGPLGRHRRRVIVRQHLEGRYSVWRGPRRLATYQPDGSPVVPDPGVVPVRDRPPGAVRRSRSRVSRPDHLSKTAGHITCS